MGMCLCGHRGKKDKLPCLCVVKLLEGVAFGEYSVGVIESGIVGMFGLAITHFVANFIEQHY